MEQDITPSKTDAVIQTLPAIRPEPQEMDQAQEWEFHPISMIFPLMSEDKVNALSQDIAVRGQLEPVYRFEGKILEGRNRYAACRLAGVGPWFEEYDGDDPLGFVIAKNVKRRHLNASQRALIAVDLESFGHGGDRQDAMLQLAMTRAKAAELMGVSERLVASAKIVKEKGAPELIEAVRRGEKFVTEAETEIKKASRAGAAGREKAKASGKPEQVTGELPIKTKKTSTFTEAQRDAAFALVDRIVAMVEPGQRAELAALAEVAFPYCGQICRDLADRLREAEAETD